MHYISLEGENLSLIAQWYTGARENWRQFFISSLSGSLHRLKNGDKVLIPRALVKRSEPMDRAFIKAARPRPIRRDKPPEKSAEPVEPLIEVVPEPVPTRPSPQELESEFLDTIVK